MVAFPRRLGPSGPGRVWLVATELALCFSLGCGAGHDAAKDDGEAARLAEALSRVDQKLGAMGERLAQIEARAVAAEAAVAASKTQAAAEARPGVPAPNPGLAATVVTAVDDAQTRPTPHTRVEVVVEPAAITIDGTTVSLAELNETLRGRVAEHDVTVDVRVDAAVRLAAITDVVDTIRDAGVERLALVKPAPTD